MTDSRIKQLQEKLRQLIKKDKKLQIFGANEDWGGHLYKLNPVLSGSDLQTFESSLRIQLPADYRTFLKQVGNGGAGPYYGLYSLETGIEKAISYSTEENTRLENPFAIDFPISKAETDKFRKYYKDCLDNGEDDSIEYFEIPEPLTGVIFLSDYGCGWSYILVVRGEMAGSIWLHGDYLCPIFTTDGLWTFADWYEDWLDKSLAELDPQPEQTEFDTSQTIINYDGWRLKEIPPEVFACKDLKKLVFSRNELSEFPKQITQFSELTILDLSMTPIIEIPKEIGELKKLKKLDLNYNYHPGLPPELAQLQNLEELSMYYNYKLAAIPDVVTELPKLKKLHFSNSSKLRKIPRHIGNMTELEEIILNDTPLKTLPLSISKLKKLKVLYIDHTKITKLPAGFENLESLEWLGINTPNLDLADTVERIKKLPRLKWLRITNQLDYPENFRELTNIRQLAIEQNYELWHQGYKTMPVPENVTLIPNIEELHMMNNNQANCLPESIGNWKNLKKIEISSTDIRRFPDSMQRLTKLKQVHGSLNDDPENSYGILPAEKEKLIVWFPKAKILIW